MYFYVVHASSVWDMFVFDIHHCSHTPYSVILAYTKCLATSCALQCVLQRVLQRAVQGVLQCHTPNSTPPCITLHRAVLWARCNTTQHDTTRCNATFHHVASSCIMWTLQHVAGTSYNKLQHVATPPCNLASCCIVLSYVETAAHCNTLLQHVFPCISCAAHCNTLLQHVFPYIVSVAHCNTLLQHAFPFITSALLQHTAATQYCNILPQHVVSVNVPCHMVFMASSLPELLSLFAKEPYKNRIELFCGRGPPSWGAYGVATISRVLKIIGFFCKIQSLL